MLPGGSAVRFWERKYFSGEYRRTFTPFHFSEPRLITFVGRYTFGIERREKKKKGERKRGKFNIHSEEKRRENFSSSSSSSPE